MVKFGRHLQFFLECEEPQCAHYIVPYNQLRDKIYTCISTSDIKCFELAWREALQKASDDFRESTHSCWSNVFESISKIPNSRGAPLESALKLYPPTMGVTASRDLLCFLKGIYSTASVNSEGLRKLVKKFDKQGPASLSSTLLPELYSSNFHIGLDALDMAIETLRELLDDLDECDNELYDHFMEEKKLNHIHYNRLDRPTQIMTRNQSYETEEIIIGKRANEMLWLRDMIRQIPQDDIKHAVAHRGFHNPKGRSDLRPLENSLAAFEAAWTNGIHLCECDVALTKDEKLVLAHDSDFSRLSLDPSSDKSNRKVSELTFKELIALTLKNGVRAPLLLDVLRSAHTIGPDAKLIIEIKPGNNQAAMALARLLARHPEYVTHVAVIMSFDLWAMHELRGALEKMLSGEPRRITSSASSPMLYADTIDKQSFPVSIGVKIPKLMLLTVAHVPADNYELWVDCNDYSPIDGWLQTDGSCLDGVYVRFENEMLEPDGAAELKALCKKYTVGVWGVVNKDPDDYETMRYLVKECGVSYFNTDLPRTFLSDSQFDDN
jgi:Glycerophosphoryl diester phosphodiesterase